MVQFYTPDSLGYIWSGLASSSAGFQGERVFPLGEDAALCGGEADAEGPKRSEAQAASTYTLEMIHVVDFYPTSLESSAPVMAIPLVHLQPAKRVTMTATHHMRCLIRKRRSNFTGCFEDSCRKTVGDQRWKSSYATPRSSITTRNLLAIQWRMVREDEFWTGTLPIIVLELVSSIRTPQ
ncbi:hypothetical protein CDD80_3457 [Ophiocordyceps camponoti-rufipedis]|uniref:Uncharacterized protein n=1 Tax=Ophiocordyceps camponoti-rufipedis TaxID=2004952 RepID=A0A2C5Z2Q1_9HYPO|nr:hypothetical protein CDD80_3457 [Ophiocordyceps camponoti-rufipedis]